MTAVLSRRAMSLRARSYGGARILTAQRYFTSGIEKTSALAFTLKLSSSKKHSSSEIFDKLRSWDKLANPDEHDAAIVLATPEYARNITDEKFMGELSSVLSNREKPSDFQLLGAVVDALAPPLGSTETWNGLSIFRGHAKHLMPRLWDDVPSQSLEEFTGKTATLAANMGMSGVYLPLANTAFHNGKDSTLFASHHYIVGQENELLRQHQSLFKQINIPLPRIIDSNDDLSIWAPLAPVTRPRTVTASFGNIIKGVEVDGTSVPASTELEDAVDKVFKQLPHSTPDSGPIGIWAVVAPEGVAEKAAEDAQAPPAMLDEIGDMERLSSDSARHLRLLISRGASVYKILSGGGGWGAKKGLLSLDPERSFRAPSDEESMQQFMQSMQGDKVAGSDFAPIGSTIQFFTSMPTTPDPDAVVSTGSIFGVHTAAENLKDTEEEDIYLGLFGGLSRSNLYICEVVEQKDSITVTESKLSVPDSRVFVPHDDRNPLPNASFPRSSDSSGGWGSWAVAGFLASLF